MDSIILNNTIIHLKNHSIMANKIYWFSLLDKDYNELNASIPDGSNKQTAINQSKRWMKENGITTAQLSVNSMRTDNILEIMEITC